MPSKRTPPRPRSRALAYAGAILGVLAGVAAVLIMGSHSVARPLTRASSATTRAAAKPARQAPAPLFRLTTLAGTAVAIPTGKPTVLYFMSASCSSCWQGSAQLSQLWPRWRGRADLISLDVTPQVDTPRAVAQMVSTTGATWPQAYATQAILSRYRVEYLDTVVVLSPRGKVVYDGAIPPNPRLSILLGKAAASGQRS